MAKVIIPYKLIDVGLFEENADFHSKTFCKRRKSILNKLRYIKGLRKVARKLDQDTVYKLVEIPEDGKLLKDSSGNIKGVFYDKNGKILQHAKFKSIQPSIIELATTIGSQIVLVEIAMQLNRIEKKISRLLNEFHNNRISEVFSGVNQFQQAMMVKDKDRQSRMIEHAIQTLNSGFEKTVRSLKIQIDNAPNPEISFGDNWRKKKSTEAEEQFALAEETFKICLMAAKTLAECYATIDEPYAATNTLIKCVKTIKGSGIELAAKKARLIPAKANKFPEQPWLSFLENESILISKIKRCHLLANKEFERIEIEIKPKELMEK